MKNIKANLYDYSGDVVFSEEINLKRFLIMKFVEKGLLSSKLGIEEIDIKKTISELNKHDELTIKSVLVADDEEILRESYSEALTRLCHYVESYSTADEAYLIFEEEPDKFDVILTDNNMPESELNGAKFAKKAKSVSKKIKVNIITGDISSVDDDVFDHDIDNTIAKPLNEYTFAMTLGKGKLLPKDDSNIIDFAKKKEMLMKEVDESISNETELLRNA
jgi:CheY-like chemotaxis protein